MVNKQYTLALNGTSFCAVDCHKEQYVAYEPAVFFFNLVFALGK